MPLDDYHLTNTRRKTKKLSALMFVTTTSSYCLLSKATPFHDNDIDRWFVTSRDLYSLDGYHGLGYYITNFTIDHTLRSLARHVLPRVTRLKEGYAVPWSTHRVKGQV
jgi:hypothetical protein